jgi:hypothetical protein
MVLKFLLWEKGKSIVVLEVIVIGHIIVRPIKGTYTPIVGPSCNA